GRFRLTPEVGGQVKALIDAGVQRRFRAERTGPPEPHATYAADELAALVLEHADPEPVVGADAPGRRSGRARTAATVHIVIDHGALVRGHALPGEQCEIPGVGPVDARWARDLLGEAFLTAVIKRGTDITTVAHFGRHVNASLRTALLVQGRECDVNGCGTRGYLEIDHVREHAKRGPTSLDNLGWLCSHHHRLKSSGWTLGARDTRTGKRHLAPPARAPDRTHAA
ncbi:MAG: HNH endonuclease signature motif containing protein, partial [Actinomycetota bacterium]